MFKLINSIVFGKIIIYNFMAAIHCKKLQQVAKKDKERNAHQTPVQKLAFKGTIHTVQVLEKHMMPTKHCLIHGLFTPIIKDTSKLVLYTCTEKKKRFLRVIKSFENLGTAVEFHLMYGIH